MTSLTSFSQRFQLGITEMTSSTSVFQCFGCDIDFERLDALAVQFYQNQVHKPTTGIGVLLLASKVEQRKLHSVKRNAAIENSANANKANMGVGYGLPC